MLLGNILGSQSVLCSNCKVEHVHFHMGVYINTNIKAKTHFFIRLFASSLIDMILYKIMIDSNNYLYL